MTRTPILDALRMQIQDTQLSLHVPGHKLGRNLPNEFSAWLGQAAKLDLTELPGLDNLQQPEGCIRESQERTSDYYGAKRTWYSVNGSTACILAAIFATCCAVDSSLVFVNPAHQSAWRGLAFAGGWPIVVPMKPTSGVTAHDAFSHEPDFEAVEHILKTTSNVAGVYVTSPTYEGHVLDITALATLAHRYGIPLLVDEAHGAHFGIASGYPEHSVYYGADIVIQSAHKMLPALTQTAWLHVQDSRIDYDRLALGMRLFQSTSPSYILLAALDAAQNWLHEEGRQVALETLEVLREGNLGNVETDGNGMIRRDPLKHWIPTSGLAGSQQLQRHFANHGIHIEYGDARGVLSVFGFGIQLRDVKRYLAVVNSFPVDDDKSSFDFASRSRFQDVFLLAPQFVLSPQEGIRRQRRLVPLAAAAGLVCADMVTPYPPGVPLLYPGQVIPAEVVQTLRDIVLAGYPVIGITANRHVSVLTL